MEAKRVIEISQKLVSFLLKNYNEDIRETYKIMITTYCPELQIMINDTEHLCEPYFATMITHRVNGFPTPKENYDGFIKEMVGALGIPMVEFVEWVKQIKADSFEGEIRIHFGIENPVFPS